MQRLREIARRPVRDSGRALAAVAIVLVTVAAVLVAVPPPRPPAPAPAAPSVDPDTPYETATPAPADEPRVDHEHSSDEVAGPAAIATAKTQARRFLNDWVAWRYENAAPRFRHAATALTARLRAADIDPASGAPARIELLQAEGATPTRITALAIVADQARRYTVRLHLVNCGARCGGWEVTQVGI